MVYEKLSEVWLISLNQCFTKRKEVTKIFLECIGHVKKGGYLFVPTLTWDAIPGGRKVIEWIIKTLKLRIEVLPSHYKTVMIASKP
jgi:hypothetical protein